MGIAEQLQSLHDQIAEQNSQFSLIERRAILNALRLYGPLYEEVRNAVPMNLWYQILSDDEIAEMSE